VNYALGERSSRLGITPIEKVCPGLGNNVILVVQLQEEALVPGKFSEPAVSSNMEASLFVNPSLAKQEESESQAARTCPEPPCIHGVEPIARLEEVNCKRHEEVVEEEIDWKLEDRFIGGVVNREDIRHGVGETPYNASQTNDNKCAIHKCREENLSQLCHQVPL
jgi:hypothetical protein